MSGQKPDTFFMKYSIIVAGGSGSRMKSDMPKQFLRIAGKPIIIITLEKFLSVKDNTVILVLPKSSFEYWASLKNDFSKEIQNIEDLENLYENPLKNININLSKNLIESIPESIYLFSNLRSLDLSNNALKNIDYIRNCTKLETLKLAHNEIKNTIQSNTGDSYIQYSFIGQGTCSDSGSGSG